MFRFQIKSFISQVVKSLWALYLILFEILLTVTESHYLGTLRDIFTSNSQINNQVKGPSQSSGNHILKEALKQLPFVEFF